MNHVLPSFPLLLAISLSYLGGPLHQAAAQVPRASAEAGGVLIVSDLEPTVTAPALEEEFAGYLLVYFKDETHSAYVAVSRDGYTFTDLKGGEPIFDGAVLAEQKGVRDPHITRGPDGGFYLAMTDLHIYGQDAGYRTTRWERPEEQYGWGNNRAIVLMKSFDLIHWTHSDFRVDRAFPELGDIGSSWAPQTVYDQAAGRMMVYFTLRVGNGDSHMYYAYTDDAFTRLETTPERLLDGEGIDGDIIEVDGTYHLHYASGGVWYAVSETLNGGYQPESRRIDPETVPTEARLLCREYLSGLLGGRPRAGERASGSAHSSRGERTRQLAKVFEEE